MKKYDLELFETIKTKEEIEELENLIKDIKDEYPFYTYKTINNCLSTYLNNNQDINIIDLLENQNELPCSIFEDAFEYTKMYFGE